MAIVAKKSTRITNAEAVLQTYDNVVVNHGRKRTAAATVELASGDSAASTIRMVRVHSSWRIASIMLFCDAITSGAADIGLYQTAANGGAVVDADAYASAQTIATASKTGIECRFESAATDIAKIEQQVWQDAGLTADPNRYYDLTLILTADTSAAGTVSLEVTYIAGD